MLDRFIRQANDAHCPGPWPVPQHNCPIGATFSQQRLGKSVELPSRFRRFENEQCKQLPSREDNKENDSTLFLPMRLFTQVRRETGKE
jgi:hypothetical protein